VDTNMQEKLCIQCGNKIVGKATKFCSYKCRDQNAKQRHDLLNPNPFKGKNTGITGTISELRVSVDLFAKGYDVFRALSHNSPCDLVANKDNKFLRIEVRSIHVSLGGTTCRRIEKRDNPAIIDIYAWVQPEKITYDPPLPENKQ
jgi:hypothetical protein